MGDILIVLFTALGGMLCGAAVIGVMVFAYLQMSPTSTSTQAPSVQSSSSYGGTPPPPVYAPTPKMRI